MEALSSTTKSEHQFNKQDAGAFKRKPLPVANGPLFTIPRLKKIKRDLLTDLPLETHECQHEILTQIRKSFHFPFSNSCYTFSRVQSVHNPKLTARYLDKRRDMKGCGYSDALVADTNAFLTVDNPSVADRMCADGVRCGNQQFSGLGVSHMAVHVCKHADILTPMKPKYGDKILLMVKVLKGKTKAVVCKNVGVQLEPTPNYDCHIAKPNVDQSAPQPPHMLFYSSQLYVYEYGDFKVEDYPRQVLPYAVVYYCIREPQIPVPKAISIPHPAQAAQPPSHKNMSSSSAATSSSSSASSPSTSSAPDFGPNNEVWRGRLHVHLVEGGHIFIEVVMLSYFVPLTVNLISPIKIHNLYPEHNALFTFFCGLTNIAQKDEVEWRAHYFRSCIMRPRVNNEKHFKALIKHISAKKEMPTVRLPHDVFLFLMPDCLLASQLGLVRRDDDSPVLHCVIMSKYSTSQAQKKHLMERNIFFKNYGSATSWESLFDDSDFSDDDDEQADLHNTRKQLRKRMPTLFRDQRYIHNKFAAMSLADAEINFAPCGCKKPPSSQNHYRTDDITRVYNAMQSTTQSSHTPGPSCFPPGSRHRPKQKMSRRAMAMPSFSPHGSSDSDLESDNSRFSSGGHDQYSLLNNTKTVEEELSEEELTNEQMEDIIFLRKPVLTASSLSNPKPLSHSASGSDKVRPPGQTSESAAAPSLKSSYSSDDLKRRSKSLSSGPRIIPTEPVRAPEKLVSQAKTVPEKLVSQAKTVPEKLVSQAKTVPEKLVSQAKTIPEKLVSQAKTVPEKLVSQAKTVPEKLVNQVKTIPEKQKIIPAVSVESCAGHVDSRSVNSSETSEPVSGKPSDKIKSPAPKVPKSILKPSSAPVAPTEVLSKESKEPVSSPSFSFPHEEENDFGDVDMRVPHQHSVSLHPVFLSAGQASFQRELSPPSHQTHQQLSQMQLSPNLSFGSWLAPGDFKTSSSAPSLLQHSLSFTMPAIPSSPPSPEQSPASPVLESPASPPSPPVGIDSESPASPPMSVFTDQLRSSPIAIPTSRVKQTATSEVSFSYDEPYSPHMVGSRGSVREGIDSADDMKNFLNSGFDMELDSEDER